MFEESLESTSSEDTEQHHIRHHNGLYEEQTISVPYIAAKPAPGKDAPVKLGAHEVRSLTQFVGLKLIGVMQIATRRLEGGMPDMSREATFSQ